MVCYGQGIETWSTSTPKACNQAGPDLLVSKKHILQSLYISLDGLLFIVLRCWLSWIEHWAIWAIWAWVVKCQSQSLVRGACSRQLSCNPAAQQGYSESAKPMILMCPCGADWNFRPTSHKVSNLRWVPEEANDVPYCARQCRMFLICFDCICILLHSDSV